VRALLVAGSCGNVGFGKLGQFARLLAPHKIPVVALDLSPAVLEVKDRLREAFGKKFTPQEIDDIVNNIRVVQGTLADVPAEIELGFVFEAIPEKLSIKRPFYQAIRDRDRDSQSGAFIFSATSGLTTKHLFTDLPGADRCGVLHPFFPHLTNKLWEMPIRDALTSQATVGIIQKLFGRFGMNLLEVRDVPAFAADRLFCGMMLEAVRIHDELGLSPAQVDDACKKLLGTSPFFVHNLIAGSNYLSAHCMELCQAEVDSSIFAVPERWRAFVADPKKKWDYEKGATCPADQYPIVRERMLGMLFSLTAYMIEHEICRADVLNFLCENALAFRTGTPALIQELGEAQAIEITKSFLARQKITKAAEVAPLDALKSQKGWHNTIFVHTSVRDGVGLISLKRKTLSHVFVAELDVAYEKLAADTSVRAIVIAPDGQLSREFGHGADPQAFMPVLGDANAASELIARWKKTLNKLNRGKPCVAALVGRVLGGGVELAAACTARIAATGTVLGQPETTVGVVPGLGGCHMVHRFSDPHYFDRINEVILTGHSYTAQEAKTWGFVSEVVDVRNLPRESAELARKLADGEYQRPALRTGGIELHVNQDVNPRNEAGVVLDAELRSLLARTIEDANKLDIEAGGRLEAERAAQSLCLSSSAIGVPSLLRGKPPVFKHPLV
jgi:enoyl-CoA hydratase/3-hydroxyacyl-CoA dehydrogenase